MEHLHLKDLHLGNWYNRKVGGDELNPVFEPIKLGEEHFIELYAEMNPGGLCFQDLYPIDLSRDVVSKINHFRLVTYGPSDSDTGTWNRYEAAFFVADKNIIQFMEVFKQNAYNLYVNFESNVFKKFTSLHEMQTFIRVTAGIELEYDPYKK